MSTQAPLQILARKNLIAACIANGCAKADIEFHLENRAKRVAAIRKERSARRAFFLSEELPWSRQDWRFWNSRRKNTFALWTPSNR